MMRIKKPSHSEELQRLCWVGPQRYAITGYMAYNKRNYYTRVLEIQRIVLREQRRYTTQKELFHKEIAPIYHISIRTFQSYLEIPAHFELEKMKQQDVKKEIARRAQLKLDFK